MKILVQVESEIISEYHSGEAYGDWSREETFHVSGVCEFKSDWGSSETFDVDDVKVGDELHVLWIVYGNGDSFGRSSGNGEVVMVYKDRAIAEQAFSMYDEKRDDYSVKIPVETPEGIKFHSFSNPGAGFFECLENIELETFTVQAG